VHGSSKYSLFFPWAVINNNYLDASFFVKNVKYKSEDWIVFITFKDSTAEDIFTVGTPLL
jgi:hypothetical protein